MAGIDEGILSICGTIRSRESEIQKNIGRLLCIRDHWEEVPDSDIEFFKEVLGIGPYMAATGSSGTRSVVIVTPDASSLSILIDLDKVGTDDWVGVSSPLERRDVDSDSASEHPDDAEQASIEYLVVEVDGNFRKETSANFEKQIGGFCCPLPFNTDKFTALVWCDEEGETKCLPENFGISAVFEPSYPVFGVSVITGGADSDGNMLAVDSSVVALFESYKQTSNQ